ncbi:MAG: hypothetical protein GF418_08060 [Chitinivibrionales bacterium]|nr:hypothetical protein [Chitinivibrionales bacterium]MBD3395567.1 hypothetical protein [Chitinivibrionales bacterium]
MYDTPTVVLECKDDFIEFYFTGTARRKATLDKWYVLPRDSEINAIECLDFRSHIDSHDAYTVHQTVLGRRKLGTVGLDVNTEDSDLMFAPHPMMFIFQHFQDRLMIAPMSLVQAESCHVKMVKGSTIVRTYHLEVGSNVYWMEEGERLESPHFMMTIARDKGVYGSLEHYTGLLVKEGLVKPKTVDDMADWWLSPMWCSWGDQHYVLDSAEVIHLAVTPEMRKQTVHNINEVMVNKAVGVIERHDLPIRTLILDDRWYTKQGDMRVDTTKFPDLRGMVDTLHDKGFKVMCWASLYQVEKDSDVYTKHPEWFVIHHYARNWHNPERDWPFLDYSNPEVRDAYLGELMERLLSNNPGCYNFDGIKFDWPFLIPHDYAYQDRDWVGKETTVYKTQKCVYQAAKAAKSDALIIGVSPHPFFNDTQDIIRTYDVSTFDYRIHTGRARYIRAVAPGMTPALDEHVFYQNFFTFIEESCKLGIPMIYNLLRFNGDGVEYGEDDYRKLKTLLDRYVDNTPKLKRYMEGLRESALETP